MQSTVPHRLHRRMRQCQVMAAAAEAADAGPAMAEAAGVPLVMVEAAGVPLAMHF